MRQRTVCAAERQGILQTSVRNKLSKVLRHAEDDRETVDGNDGGTRLVPGTINSPGASFGALRTTFSTWPVSLHIAQS
jgi:hypothetical protein